MRPDVRLSDVVFLSVWLCLGVSRALRQIDPGFDVPQFVEEMREDIIPQVVRAFLLGDRKTLAFWCAIPSAPCTVFLLLIFLAVRRCKESALSQVGAHLRAREPEGLQLDPTILSVSHVDMQAAKIVSKTSPILVVSAMVQQINCITNKKVGSLCASATVVGCV